MNSHEDLVEHIFSQALEKSSGERAAFLDHACAGHPDLLARVRELLLFHDKPSGPLDHPPCDHINASSPANGLEGSVIGRYKLLEKIGEGGMGVVYMAEQQTPVKRKVALKIIKPGMDTKQVIARFEAERQALAIMDHPNIAKVLDAESTGSGRPYFVMELVRGIPVTGYCDQNQLTVSARVELFIKVCRAIQHAHQKGIIHRDLKPTNVLVTLQDGVPVPKVIDFGVAKAIRQELTERTLFTNFAQMVGTPLYMSPEQAELSGLDVDTRTDIYSLGVLLYELLTGTTPFQKETLKKAGYEEIRRNIREVDPPRPSVRLSTLSVGTSSTISVQRGADSRKLNQQIRGELDWMVMKALEKDRTRRYESASHFVSDLERFLAGEPVEACPPSLLYRLRKFIHRHRPFVAIICLIFGFLILSTIGLIVSMAHISKERSEALLQRNLAQETSQTLRSYLYAADIQLAYQAYNSGDGETVRRKLLVHRPNEGEADQRGFEWHYLWNLCQDQFRLLRPHREAVYHVAFSPDGTKLASASDDRTVVITNLGERAKSLILKNFRDDINGVDFSADGTRLATAEENGQVRIWDAQSGRELLRLVGFDQPVARAYFHANGRNLVATEVNWQTNEGRISIWDLSTKTRLQVVEGFRALAVHRDKDLLAACSAENELSLWSLPDLRRKSIWRAHESQILCASFRSDGQQLVTGSRAGKVKLWDLETLGETLCSQEHAGAVRDVAMSSEGHILVSVGDDGVTKIWDLPSAVPLRIFEEKRLGLWTASLSPDGNSMAIGRGDGSIVVRSLKETFTEKERILKTPQGLADVGMDLNGRRVAAILRDTHHVSIFDVKSGKRLAEFADPFDSAVEALSFSESDGRLWAGNAAGMVYSWNVKTKGLGPSFELCRDKISDIFVSPNGRYVAVNSWDQDRKTIAWDRQTDEVIPFVQGRAIHRSEPPYVLAGYLNDSIVLTVKASSIHFWDLGAQTRLAEHFKHANWCMGVAISPDQKILATATEDHCLHLWNIATGEKLAKLSGHKSPSRCLAFSPDGRTLASGSDSGEIKLWHVPTRQHLFDLRGHKGRVSFLNFASGQRLVSAAELVDGSGEILVWGVSQAFPSIETNP